MEGGVDPEKLNLRAPNLNKKNTVVEILTILYNELYDLKLLLRKANISCREWEKK